MPYLFIINHYLFSHLKRQIEIQNLNRTSNSFKLKTELVIEQKKN